MGRNLSRQSGNPRWPFEYRHLRSWRAGWYSGAWGLADTDGRSPPTCELLALSYGSRLFGQEPAAGSSPSGLAVSMNTSRRATAPTGREIIPYLGGQGRNAHLQQVT